MSFFFTDSSVIVRVWALLVNETPVSVGAGREASVGGVDNPVVRLNGRPFIPGSSIKGVLRSEAERYVRALNGDVCDVVADPDEEKRRADEGRVPCVVCRVFGGPTIASHVYFMNAVPISYNVESRTCVSIFRLTGGQFPGRLYSVEYISPGCEFEWGFHVDGYDIVEGSGLEVELINYLVRKMINEGVWIGRRRSTGHGLVKIRELRRVEREKIIDGRVVVEDLTSKYLERIRRG